MASYAELVRTPPTDGSIETEAHSEGLDRQWERLRKLATMAEVAGPFKAAHLLFDRLTGINHTAAKELEVDDPEKFRHPLLLTTTISDLHNYHEIAKDRVYDLPRELDEEIDGRAIFDLGAYIGTSAAYFATRYPRSPVLAVEPNPRNYRLLQANAANYGDQISPRFAAVGLNNEPVGMMSHSPDNRSHMSNVFSSDYDANGNGSQPARGVTPEDLVSTLGNEDRVGVLKVDIEGAETQLFGSTMIDPLLARTDILMIETHENFEIGQGSSQIVAEAAGRSGLTLADFDNGHTTIYAR